MNPAIIDVGGQSWCTVEDPSRDPLGDGGFETGALAPYWAVGVPTGQIVAGQRPGGSGVWLLEVLESGVAGPFTFQGALTVGVTYWIEGWVIDDGVNAAEIRCGGALVRSLPVTGAWQYFRVLYTAVAAGFWLCSSAPMGSGGWARWDDIKISPLIARTPNVGSLGGRLDMGDGLTPATLPTRTPNTTAGFTFNGSQYLQWMSPITSNVFTYCALVMRTTPGANSAYLCDARAGGGVGYVWWSGVQLESSSGTIYVDDVPGIALPYGKLALVTCSGITIAAPSKIVVQASNVLANGWVGNVLGQALVPGTMTPMQMRDMKNRLLARAFQ